MVRPGALQVSVNSSSVPLTDVAEATKELTMAVATPRSRTALAPTRAVLYGVLILATLSVIGAMISVASDLSPTLLDAMGPRGRLSIPLPMTIAQIAMAVAAGSSRRIVAMIGSGFIAAALFAGAISGFFDGGYGDERLTVFERVYQVSFVAALAVVGGIAAARFLKAMRATSRSS
jgi:hypothetical protein